MFNECKFFMFVDKSICKAYGQEPYSSNDTSYVSYKEHHSS